MQMSPHDSHTFPLLKMIMLGMQKNIRTPPAIQVDKNHYFVEHLSFQNYMMIRLLFVVISATFALLWVSTCQCAHILHDYLIGYRFISESTLR